MNRLKVPLFGAKSIAELDRPGSVGFTGDGKKASFLVDFPFTKATKKDDQGIETGALLLKGYASTWIEDRDGDFIDPDAFNKSLPEYLAKNPIVLWQHDMKCPIGTMSGGEIDQFGLNVEVEVPLPGEKEPDWKHLAYNSIARGIVKTFSIGGFFTREFVMGRSVIKEVELMEVSVVSIPSNPDSLFEAAAKAIAQSSRRPALMQGHIKQMKQLLGLEVMGDPELVVMTPDERIARYELLKAYYTKAGLRAPDLDAWKKLEPEIMGATGHAVVGPAREMAELMRRVNGGIVDTDSKRGRILSKTNEAKLRDVRSLLEDGDKRIDEMAAEAKRFLDETRAELDVVLKQVEDAPEQEIVAPDEEEDEDGEPDEEEEES